MTVDLDADELDLLAALVRGEAARLAALPRPQRVAARYGYVRALRAKLDDARLFGR
jgi:hypothetical protein